MYIHVLPIKHFACMFICKYLHVMTMVNSTISLDHGSWTLYMLCSIMTRQVPALFAQGIFPNRKENTNRYAHTPSGKQDLVSLLTKEDPCIYLILPAQTPHFLQCMSQTGQMSIHNSSCQSAWQNLTQQTRRAPISLSVSCIYVQLYGNMSRQRKRRLLSHQTV